MSGVIYFKAICFIWALIGIGSRIAMGIMGEKWKAWELDKVYMKKKPKFINFFGFLGYLIVIFTWYQVVVTDVKYSWIIAIIMSATLIKISAILFNYDAFRAFGSALLNDKKRMFKLNVGVLIFSIVLILMGLFVY